MTSIRPAAVADMFYPGRPSVLARDVEDLLEEARARPGAAGTLPKAVIVPHAGYIYSGPVAATAYARLQGGRGVISRVVLLGPVHRVPVRGLALPGADAFATPLGNVPLDAEAVAAIRGLPQVVVSAQAHALEHSLEVQLPFLQTVLGEFRLLPLAVGDASAQDVAQVLELLWGGGETLIVVSSDLSHYLPYDLATKVDAETTRRILDLSVDIRHVEACGGTPVNGLLLAARRHGLSPELLDLRNSGDTAGDRSRVVGYASFAFLEVPHVR
ncbi:MAG TPA: AmmeMemoRadiSam system protein B [Burkholderiales bacterium]